MTGPSRRQILVGGAAVAALPVGGAAWMFGVEPGWLEVTSHQVAIAGLPRPLAGLRIVQITDVHLHGVHRAARAVAAALHAHRPDVIVLTGDLVDAAATLPELTAWLRDFPACKAMFASLGNWEHWGDVPRPALEAACARAGAELLVDRSASITVDSARVRVIGFEDAAGRPDPTTALRDPDGDARLWLAHQPGFVDALATPAARLQTPPPHLILAGHTHGGQVDAPWGALVTPPGSGRYVAGWYNTPAGRMYVSRGVGTSVVPARLMARPELALFTLEPA